MSRWIKCSELMPNDSTDVLVWSQGNEMAVAYRRLKEWRASGVCYDGFGHGKVDLDGEPSHWRDLPEPPK